MPHTLLLADDSVTIQRVIELTFADEDIRVISVGDGQQAIDRVTADPPDIVLADTGMPERDGYEVATFIKNDPKLAHIPVVLLTGAFEPVDGDRATEAGCDAVLVKPFEPQEVIRRVRELLGQAAAPVASADTAEQNGGHEAEHDPDGGLPAGFEPRPRPLPDVDRGDTSATPRLVSSETSESRTNPDDADPDPVSVYLDRVDAALDLLDNDRRTVEDPAEPVAEEPAAPTEQAVEPVAEEPAAPTEQAVESVAEEPVAPTEQAVEPPAGSEGTPLDDGPAPALASEPAGDPTDLDSLEGALSALEGALENLSLEPSAPIGEAPATSKPQSSPVVEPVEEALEPVFAPVADSILDSTGEPAPAATEEPEPESESPAPVFAPVVDPIVEAPPEPLSDAAEKPEPESLAPVFAPVADLVAETPPEPTPVAVDEPASESLEPVFAPVADASVESDDSGFAPSDEPAPESPLEPASTPGVGDANVPFSPDVASTFRESLADDASADSAGIAPVELVPPTVADELSTVEAATDDPPDETAEEVVAQISAPATLSESAQAAAQELAAELSIDQGMDPEVVPDAAAPPPVVDSPPVPEAAGAPARPAPQAPVSTEWAGPAPMSTPPGPPPSLADAFSSLLAAEQGATAQPRAPYPWPTSPRAAGSDGDLVERVTDRVLARLSDTVTTELVTQIVTQVAERLVRAELDRQKP